MNRFYIENTQLTLGKGLIIENPQDLHHMLKVLRLVSGNSIEICNGLGQEAIGLIESLDKKQGVIQLTELVHINRESPVEITLFQGLPKAHKMELILQKCTEVGVHDFVPVITERSVVKIHDLASENKKRERWKTIIDEAAKQCKRGILPNLAPLSKLMDASQKLCGYDLILVPHTGEGTLPLREVVEGRSPHKIAVWIGPEGGFTEEEAQHLSTKGAQLVSLGPRILRTETAGTSICSILQYVFGDMGGI